MERVNDTKKLEWQNGQLKLIEQDNWENQKFIFVFIYSTF